MAIGPILQSARLKKQLTESQVAEITRMKIQIVQDLEKDDFHRLAATIYGKGFIKLFAECVDLDPKPLIADYIRSVQGDNPSLITKGVDNPGPNIRPQPLPPPDTATTHTDTNNEPELPLQSVDEQEPESLVVPEPDDENDLFAYSKKKNTIEDDSILHTEPQTVTETPSKYPSELISAAKERIAETATILHDYLNSLVNKLADIQWGDAPLRIIGIVIGALVLMLIIAISISSCRAKPKATTHTDSTLQIPVNPPEPYFD
jgi:hypothetical protein